MPLPMPEEEENLRCPHGERVQALMLCSLDCAVSGAHPDRKAKADGRFIITPWWCLNKCRWLHEHEMRSDSWRKSRIEDTKKSPSRREPRGGFSHSHSIPMLTFLRRWEDAFCRLHQAVWCRMFVIY